ncbi:hypothetical protein ABPG72_018764 [Tetrahymena utriculariae]
MFGQYNSIFFCSRRIAFDGYLLNFQTKRYIDNQKLISTCYYLRTSKLVPFSKSCFKDYSSFLLKSLIHYLQLSSIVLTFKVQFNPQTAYQSAGQPVDTVFLNFKCFMSLNTFAKYQMANIQVLIRSLIPFIVFLILFLFLILIKLIKRSVVKQYHFISSMSFCFLFFLSDTIKFITDAFSCRQIGNQKYLKIDVSVACSDESYQKFAFLILIPVLVFWLVFPSVMLILIRRKRNNLDSCLAKFSFGSYYAEYKDQYYYWEFIKIYLKVIVVFLYTQTQQYGPSSLFLISIIISTYMLTLQKYKPFQNTNNQFFEIVSHSMLVFNMNLSSLSTGFYISTFDYMLTICHHSFVLCQVIMIILVIVKDGSGIINKYVINFIKFLNIKYLVKYFQANKQTNYEVFSKWKKVYEKLNLLTELKTLNQISQLNAKRQNTPQQKNQTSVIQNFLQRQVTQAREISDYLTNGMITNMIHQSSIHARQLVSPRSIVKVNGDLHTNSQIQINNIKSDIIEDGNAQIVSNFCLKPVATDKYTIGRIMLSQHNSRENSHLFIQNQGNQSNHDFDTFKPNSLDTPKILKPQQLESQSKYDKEYENESEIDIEQENQFNSGSPVQDSKVQCFKSIKK